MTTDVNQLDEKLMLTAYKKQNFTPIIDSIKKIVLDGRVFNMDVKADQAELRSRAQNIRKSKTVLDKFASTRIKSLKDTVKVDVDNLMTGKKMVVAELDALIEEVRKPLSEWEKVRTDIDQTILFIKQLGQVHGLDSANIEHRIIEAREFDGKSKDIVIDKLPEYVEAVANTIQILEGQVLVARQREADAAELEALRRNQQERPAQTFEAPAQESPAPSNQHEPLKLQEGPLKSVSTLVPPKAREERQREVNKDILAALVQHCSISESSAKSVIAAIARGQISNVSITY